MIPYVEVIGKYNLKSFAVVEPSQCWFELSYYDIGQFEVYAVATDNNINALKKGNYIKIPNQPYIWVIKSVDYSFNSEGARMIDVKGFEAKWLVSQRIILQPTSIETDLATAFYNLILKNLGLNALSYRKIQGLNVRMPSFSITIDQTQAARGDLWEFVQALLKANKCGCYMTYENGQLYIQAIQGKDKSASIIFSQSMDNLITSDYYENSEEYKTFVRVVSTFNENDQDVDYVQDYDTGKQNIDRYEMLLASNISTKYTDANGNEQEVSPSSSTYKSWQRQEGKNALSEKIILKEFNGEIDLQNSLYRFSVENDDNSFFIGDLLLVRDEFFGYEAPARVIKYTFKQDENGYGEEAEYQTQDEEETQETGFLLSEDLSHLATEENISLATEESNIVQTPNRKISELDEVTNIEDGYIPVVVNNETKKMKLSNIPTGTSDYQELNNKPQIEGNELNGNKTFSQLGLAPMDSVDINSICD